MPYSFFHKISSRKKCLALFLKNLIKNTINAQIHLIFLKQFEEKSSRRFHKSLLLSIMADILKEVFFFFFFFHYCPWHYYFYIRFSHSNIFALYVHLSSQRVGVQKSLPLLLHSSPHFWFFFISCWTCSCPEYAWKKKQWPLDVTQQTINQSIIWSFPHICIIIMSII